MEVIIHLPRSKEGQEELAKRVATVHVQLIYNYISTCIFFVLCLVIGVMSRTSGISVSSSLVFWLVSYYDTNHFGQTTLY